MSRCPITYAECEGGKYSLNEDMHLRIDVYDSPLDALIT